MPSRILGARHGSHVLTGKSKPKNPEGLDDAGGHKFRLVMAEFGKGTLHSGGGGKVTKLAQAQRIAFEMGRDADRAAAKRKRAA